VNPNDGTSRVAVVAALVAVQVFFGLHYNAARYILTALPPRGWATIRIVAAAALLMTFVLATRRKRLPRAPRDLAAIALFSVFGVMINQVCFIEGLARTATPHSSIINTFIPVATLLIAILLGRERATPRKLAGIGLSICGVLYLVAHSGTVLGGGVMLGDLLTLTNGLSYSFFLVISKPILSRHSSLAVTAELLLFGAVGISLAGAPQLATVDFRAVPASIWWMAAFVVVFCTVAAYILNAWALKRVDSSLVALFIYLQPLVASTVAVAFQGERLGMETLVAAALIFTGVGVALRASSTGAPAGPATPVQNA
jgi:drug/metabolite transporter (DMT)-like permease